MKKILLILLFPFLLSAQSFLISNIELPKTFIQNLDPYECDEDCLEEFLEEGLIFSFLAHADSKIDDSELEKMRKEYLSFFNIRSVDIGGQIKIALLLPYKKIGRYAASTTNASFAYLMSRSKSFELKSYKVESESYEDISEALRKIEEDRFDHVIAPLTQFGEDVISQIDPRIDIYFPTINKKDSKSESKYLYYGGIDYRAQSNLLLNEAESPLVIFYDKSTIGKSLSSYQEEEFLAKDLIDANSTIDEEPIAYNFYDDVNGSVEDEKRTVIKFIIPKRRTNLEKQLKENVDIVDGSFVVNTPIIKTGMIMSQLTLYDTNATNILSTQTNYNPLILSMTQYQDRKNMIIANSITQHKDVIIETNSLLGNDIVYDWINYTTTIGIDYFLSKQNGEKREYDIEIVDNQMVYPIELIQPSLYKFIPYYSSAR